MQRKIHLILTSLFVLGLFGGPAFTLPLAHAAETEGQAAAEKPVDPNADQWFVRCEDKEEDGKKIKQCEAFQRLVIQKTNQRLIEFAVAYVGPDKKLKGTAIIPLGTILSYGAEIRVDGNPPLKNQILYCTADGCFVHFDLDDKTLQAMKTGSKVVVTFVLTTPKKLNVELSLKGFGKAFDQL